MHLEMESFREIGAEPDGFGEAARNVIPILDVERAGLALGAVLACGPETSPCWLKDRRGTRPPEPCHRLTCRVLRATRRNVPSEPSRVQLFQKD